MLHVQLIDGKVPCETIISWGFMVFLLLGSSPSMKVEREVFGTVNENIG